MNPFEMQKQMFQEWEKNLGKYLEATMRQPEFMKIVGKNLEATMDFQGAVKKQLQKALRAGGIPTDAQLAEMIATQFHGLRESLQRALQEAEETNNSGRAAQVRHILARLESLQDRLGRFK